VSLILKSVTLRPPDRPSLKRKARGREVAGVVHYCPECRWESEPCRTLAETRKKPFHECLAALGTQMELGAKGRVLCG
jgi:hypothetical protein